MDTNNFQIENLFQIESSLIELILRGTIIYFGILILLRAMPRRTAGELAVMDLIFVILIGEAITHSLGKYSSITEGFVVVLTLLLWNYAINWLSFRSPRFATLVSAPALQIIRHGKLLKRNMRRELITETELYESLRKNGISDITQIKKAYVESDGAITFIKY